MDRVLVIGRMEETGGNKKIAMEGEESQVTRRAPEGRASTQLRNKCSIMRMRRSLNQTSLRLTTLEEYFLQVLQMWTSHLPLMESIALEEMVSAVEMEKLALLGSAVAVEMEEVAEKDQ